MSGFNEEDAELYKVAIKLFGLYLSHIVLYCANSWVGYGADIKGALNNHFKYKYYEETGNNQALLVSSLYKEAIGENKVDYYDSLSFKDAVVSLRSVHGVSSMNFIISISSDLVQVRFGSLQRISFVVDLVFVIP